MRKEGDRLIVEPAPKPSLLALLATWDDLPEGEAMPPIEKLPAEPIDL